MSGQGWEVVGKGSNSKKPNVPAKKLTKTEKRKFVENAPKIEDILPLDQIRTLYTSLDNKENKKPQANITKENEAKKIKKKIVEKKREPVKSLPKSLESAVNLLDVNELMSVVDLNQARFPDVPLLCLKGLAEYLNTRLTHTGSSPLPRPRDTYAAILPSQVKDILNKAVSSAGVTALQHYYEHSLAAMANDLSKGNVSVSGYKILLQLAAQSLGATLLVDCTKLTALRTSYQNNQPIGLAILWSLGQIGNKDVCLGLKVWMQFMAPLLEMKNYSSFVVSYLKEICTISRQSKPPGPDQLMVVLDTVYSPSLNLPSNLRQELYEAASALTKRTLKFESDKRLHHFFQPFLKRLNTSITNPLKNELLSSLVFCLQSDKETFSFWNALYEKNLIPSAILLQHISVKEWESFNVKLLQSTVLAFHLANTELLKVKQRGDAIKNSQAACEDLLQKMTVTRSFPWRFGSFLLLLALAGLVAVDVQKHGSFKACSTGRFLQDVGALKYGEQAWTGTKQGFSWAQQNVPVYYKETCEKAKPYLHQAKEAAFLAGSYANQTYWNVHLYTQEKAPLVKAWVNHYAPGLIDAIQTQSVRLWTISKEKSILLGDFMITQSYSAFDWAKTNIFVGNLSPEKLQQYSQEAINTTQVYAIWTYDWVREKVHTLSKVQ